MSLFYFLESSEESNVYPRNIQYDLTVNSIGKAFAHVRNCLLMKKAHGTNRIMEERKH
jgi:hypothetical protein